MKTPLVLALALTAALSGCGGDNGDDNLGQASPTPSSGCAQGPGTTDLTKKPVVTVPEGAVPTQTTTVDIVVGTGAEAKVGSNVEVKYVGALYSDCTVFDASWNRGATSTLPFRVGGGVIPGFSLGTKGMKVGGRREVIIPAKDGYGDQGSPPLIPGGATLIFVIDLVKVS